MPQPFASLFPPGADMPAHLDSMNLAELLHRQSDRLGPRPALSWRKHGCYRHLSWQAYFELARACAAALVAAGIAPGDRVALLSENRPEWLITDMGILLAGGVNVPPHAPLTARQVAFQLADAGARWAFVSTSEQLAKIESVRPELPHLKGVVAFDDPCPNSAAVQMETFLQGGRRSQPEMAQELARREAALGLGDLATIMYTSGTTGNPKGVMLTHGNLLSNVWATLASEVHGPDDIQFSWLPYSHIYARTLDHYLNLASGNVLVLAESPETLVEELKEVRPTHMNSVPRFYEKVWTARLCPDPGETSRRLRGVFGPRIKMLSSGGAPLPRAVADAFIAAGLPLLPGYGLTESAPVISFNRTTRSKVGTAGLPLPGVEVRIAPDGEILTRGPHVMPGYWNNPQATAEAIRDGWLHTGDLGSLDTDGFLTITGRKKELLVLSSGKKVVPSIVEGLLVADPCIDQAVVCGEGRSFLTALVVPHWENVLQEVAALPLDAAERCGHPAVRSLLQTRIAAALKDLSPSEQVKKFVVLPRSFTVADEELTVSLKLRRNVVLARHQQAVDRLYE